MGMTGSSDTGIVDWSLLGVNGYGAMVELTKVCQSCLPAHVLSWRGGLPSVVTKHVAGSCYSNHRSRD